MFKVLLELRIFKGLLESPFATSLASGAILVSGSAVVDFNREVIVCTNYEKKSGHLATAMENLHDLARKHDMQFANIVANKDYCDETRYLYESAVKKKTALMKDNENPMSSELAEDTVASEYHGFAMRMCRRSLLRHGHFIKWGKAITQDEFVNVLILPILSFFLVRHYRPLRPKNIQSMGADKAL